MPGSERSLGEHVALVEVLDRVLGKGAVIVGEVVIAVAEIDLVRLHLQLVLGTVETLSPKLGVSEGKAAQR